MEILEKIGLSKGEGKVYEAIMNCENPTLEQIHEVTGLDRRNIYDAVNKLITKGLAAYFIENSHKIYKLTHPNNLLKYLEEQKIAIQKKRDVLLAELPEIVKNYSKSKSEMEVRIYRGKDGIKSLFNEMLDYPHHYFIGGNWGRQKYLGKEWCNLWDKKRVARRIWWHDIITQKLLAEAPPHTKYYEKKVLPSHFWSPNVIFIFGNRVVNLFWREPLFAVEVENADIAKNYVSYFKYVWNSLN